MSIVYDRATLPVLRTAEVAVCGGSFAGVAAALAVARAGRSVIVRFEGHYHGWPDNILWSAAPPLHRSRGCTPAK